MEERRSPRSDGAHGDPSACFLRTYGTLSEPRYSNPAESHGGVPAEDSSVSTRPNSGIDGMARQLIPMSDLESTTIQKQRRELQLLIAELKDRDRELNSLSASHHKQFRAWEQDRQRVLTLEKRCARMADELQKRNEVIRALTKCVKIVETREKDLQRELIGTHLQLQKLGQKQQHISQKCQEFEEKNQSLSSTVTALSSQVGSLQVREEELSSKLKLKDKDVTEATTHIENLTGRLHDLENSLKERRSQESRLLRDIEDYKLRQSESMRDNAHLRVELQQHMTQSSAQREEIIHLKQEQQLLRRDLAFSGDGETWKDELLELARSKQERTESELHCLRQVCENQQNDIQLLQINLESARETLRDKSGPELLCSEEDFKNLHAQSPPVLRMRTSWCANDGGPLAAGEPDVLSQATKDASFSFTACCLQRLLDESNLRVASLETRLMACSPINEAAIEQNISPDDSEALQYQACQTSSQESAALMPKVSESLPKA